MGATLPILAGMASTAIFAGSVLPMPLHLFYMISSALMLYWCLRYRPAAAASRSGRDASVPLTAGRPQR